MKRIFLVFLLLSVSACDRTKGLAKEAARSLENKKGEAYSYFFSGNDLYLYELRETENGSKALQVSLVKTDTDLGEYRTKEDSEQQVVLDALLFGICEDESKCPKMVGGRSVVDFDINGKADVYIYFEKDAEGKERLFGINLKTNTKIEGDGVGEPSSEDRKMAQSDYAAMLERVAQEIRKGREK